MATDKEQTRVMALQHYGLRRLPARLKDGELYANAVVLLLKTDGKEYYGVQGPDRQGDVVLKADFEETHGVAKVLEVYPVTRFKAEINGKPLERASKQDMTRWLAYVRMNLRYKMVPDDDALEAMGKEALAGLCLRCLRRQADAMLKSDLKMERNGFVTQEQEKEQ